MLAKDVTVAFSGHRTYCGEADELLLGSVEALYDEGFRRFLCGMAWGFDLAAGEAVVELKRTHPDVELVAVVPFADFERLFSDVDACRFSRVKESADEVVVVSAANNIVAFRQRNDFLVDNASYMVVWFDQKPKGGTAYTVKRARKAGVVVENLYPIPQLELEF